MRLQTVKESITRLDVQIQVQSLFREVLLEGPDLNLTYEDSQLVMEASNYLSGHLLGETPADAFQLPAVASLIYATEVLKSQTAFTHYQQLVDDFKYVNDGNILNLLTITNCMNIYHLNIKKTFVKRLTVSMIYDVKKLAERIVLYSKVNNFVKNIYGFSGCYTNKTNRGHKISLCDNKIFMIDSIDDNFNNKGLELISYYVLLKRNKDFNNISNIKELVIFDPVKNKELIVNVADINEQLINEITEKVI